MTVDEAQAALAKTTSPHLRRDLEKFIRRQRRKQKGEPHERKPEPRR